MLQIPIKVLNGSALAPRKATDGSAGYDLTLALPEDTLPIPLEPNAQLILPTGISLSIPPGFAGYVLPRSGLACKQGVTVSNSPGLIDSDYRGEIKVCLTNHSPFTVHLNSGDRVAQLVILPVIACDFIVTEELEETDRGENGFGSTGEK